MFDRKSKPDRLNLPDPASISLPRLDDDPEWQAAIQKLRGYEARLKQAENERKLAVARLRKIKPLRPNAERADDLVRGAVIPAADPQAIIDAKDAEADILTLAISRQHEILREISSRVAAEASSRFVDLNRSAHLAIYQIACDLSAAYGVIHQIHAALYAAGLGAPGSVLPSFQMGGQLAIGWPENPHSQLTAMRLWLVTTGFMKE